MEAKKFFICPACKERSFIKVQKEFAGFKVVAKRETCAMCGYAFKPDEEVSFIKEKSIFGDEEPQEKNFCRDCGHYVASPYMQKCMRHNKEVTALDSCGDFVEQEKEDS